MSSSTVTLAILLAATVGLTTAEVGVKAVSGSVSCGGTGTFLDMDSAGCNVAPCDITVGTTYNMGISFVAGETTSNVVWNLWLYYPGGGVNRVQEFSVSGTIVAGNSYRISNDVVLADRWANIPGEIAIMINNGDTGARLMCGEFAVNTKAPGAVNSHKNSPLIEALN